MSSRPVTHNIKIAPDGTMTVVEAIKTITLLSPLELTESRDLVEEHIPRPEHNAIAWYTQARIDTKEVGWMVYEAVTGSRIGAICPAYKCEECGLPHPTEMHKGEKE